MNKIFEGGPLITETGDGDWTLLDYFASGANEGDIKTYRKPKEDYAGNQFRERTRVEARYAYAAAMVSEKRRLENIDA